MTQCLNFEKVHALGKLLCMKYAKELNDWGTYMLESVSTVLYVMCEWVSERASEWASEWVSVCVSVCLCVSVISLYGWGYFCVRWYCI